jgi:hypothetical protein
MKPLKFINFNATAFLFCCSLLTVTLISGQSPAQTINHDLIERSGSYDTVSKDLINKVCYDAMVLFGGSSGVPTLCPGPIGYPGGMTAYVFPPGTAVYTTTQTCNPVPIGCTNCDVTINPLVYIPLENRAAPKQIPDSVTIGKVVLINQLLLPGQMK